MGVTRAPDVHVLLANADWLARLSRQLCRDQHAADDAAQETLLASLRSPPRHDGNVRAFLATLLRNVLRVGHRAEARRARREQRLPPRDFAEAADLVAARAEVHQVLGRLVLELPEPQRTLVLLCYFEGQDVDTVAAHARMSLDAVHAHLRRARDTLRSRLQANDARRWSAPALALLERTLWLAPGVLAMTMKTKVAAAALAVAALCWWTLPANDAAPLPDATRAPEAVAPATADVPTPRAEAAARVDATHAAPSPAPPPAIASDAPKGRLTGRVVDQGGTPVVPARVYAVALRDGKPSRDHALQDDVDDHGRFEMPATFDGDVLVVGIPLRTIPGSTGTDLHERLVAATARTLVDREQSTELADLVCAPAVSITGIVREPGNRGVPGVRIGWYPTEETYSVLLDDFVLAWLPSGGVHVDVTQRAGGSAFNRGTATDADGRFTIATTARARGWMFLMGPHTEAGMERLVAERRITAPAAVDFDLLAPACVRVVADGKPLANRPLAFELDTDRKEGAWQEDYRTDANGEIRILRERLAPIRGRALRPGREPLDFVVPDDATPANPLVVDLGVVRTTAVQVVVTSEHPLRALGGSMSRIDVPPAPIGMTQDAGATVVSLRADVPRGPYRLVLYPARGAEGSDAFVMRQVQDVTVGNEPVSIPVRVQHGGRIRVTVTTKDAQHVEGTVRLVGATGAESKPSMNAKGRGNGEGGKLWAPGPLTTSQVLAPGRYEVIVDHGARGTHRQFVDVRACEVADVAITLR